MSDEIDLSHVEIQDHNELMEYIRILLEKVRSLTALYNDNLTLLNDHNEAANAHADIRATILDNANEADTKLDNLRTEINNLINVINSEIDALENRATDIEGVNNVQNDRLDSAEYDLSLKIYDSAVSGVGHTGDFDDLLHRPNIVINDADGSNSGAAVKLSKNRTALKLPSTIKANIVGNVSGDMMGNAATATKLKTARTINGTNFDGSGNITTANWGTARNISIQDHNAGHTGSAVSVNGSGNVTLKLPSTINANVVGYLTGNISGSSSSCTGNAATATKLQTARSINGTNFDGSGNITTANWGTARNISIQDHNAGHTGSAVSVNGSGNVTLKLPSTINANVVGYLTGNISGSSSSCTGNSATATTAGAVSTSVVAGGTKDLVYAGMADNDLCRIRCGGTSDAGYLEIATADNGNEPIYVRQFNGVFSSVARTLTLLDGSGNTQFPGTVTAPTFSGNLNGNCSGTAGSVAWNNVSGKPSAFTPYFANGTWYAVGDDAAIGDHNVGGGLGVKALNSTTTRIDLCYRDDAANYKSITYDGTTLYMNGNCNYATSAGSAGSVAWTNVSGRPTALSQFTNNSGFITSEIDSVGSGWVRFKCGIQFCWSTGWFGFADEEDISSRSFTLPKPFKNNSYTLIGLTFRIQNTGQQIIAGQYSSYFTISYSTSYPKTSADSYLAIGWWK